MHPDYEGGYKNPFPEKAFTKLQAVSVSISVASEDLALTTETDEAYSISIQQTIGKKETQERSAIKGRVFPGGHEFTKGDSVHVGVTAPTYYGARLGLETLAQMISYDDLSDTLQIYDSASVSDKPEYKHRGILLDTSR